MASSYDNDLRLNEMATGDQSGAWGTVTNLNLEIIAEAFSYGTRAIADASTDNITLADGASDADRSMYLKLTGGGQACTVSLLPNTVSKVWMIENATSYTLTFTQGSGANVAVLAGQVKMIATDGAGSGAVVYDLFTDVNFAGTTHFDNIDVDGTTNLDAVDIDGAVQVDATVTVGVDDTGYDVKFFGDTASAFMQWDASADDLILGGAAGLIVPDGKLTLGSTAVTSTGAELNILDGVTSNATEINILDAITRGSIIYGNSSGATARLAAGDADQVLTSDGTDISWADGGGGGTTIPSGTLMLFNQTAAPTGFTKVTTHNDKALRITSGTVGTGGSVAFETAFASQAVSVAATTIATSTMPSHNHSYNLYGLIAAVTNKIGSSSAGYGATNVVTSTGGGGSHTHTGTAIDLDVAYVDVIIASKD